MVDGSGIWLRRQARLKAWQISSAARDIAGQKEKSPGFPGLIPLLTRANYRSPNRNENHAHMTASYQWLTTGRRFNTKLTLINR
jgi:hypothetical protein